MVAPSAAAVANWFLDKASSEHRTLDQLQLHKLLYYADGWYLANKDETLFQDDIYAWKHGPVVRSIWPQFREFGRGPITSRAFELQIPPGGSWLDGRYQKAQMDSSDADRLDLCEKIWDAYGKGKFSGIQLSNMTHARDEPWSLIRQTEGLKENPLIPPPIIKAAFKKKLQSARMP